MTASLAVVLASLGACSNSKASEDISQLLKLVPGDAEVVATLHPAAIVKSAGGEWTSEGLKPGKAFEELIETVEGESITSDKKYKKACEIQGLNPEGAVIFCDGARDWYFLANITDAKSLGEYFEQNTSLEQSEEDGMILWSNSGSRIGALVIDDNLLWGVTCHTDDAVDNIKQLKKRAADSRLDSWIVDRLTRPNDLMAAVARVDQLGFNLNGLLAMAGVPSEYNGDGFTTLAFNMAEADHKGTASIDFLDSKGNAATILSDKVLKGGSFDAYTQLPKSAVTTMALALSGKTLMQVFPTMESELRRNAGKQIVDMVANINSLAVGMPQIDINDLQSNSNNPTKVLADLKGTALVIGGVNPFDLSILNGLLEAQADGSYSLKIDDSSLIVRGVGNAVIISLGDVTPGNLSVPGFVSDNAFMFSATSGSPYKGNDYITASEGQFTLSGITGSATYSEKAPGIIEMCLEYMTAAVKAQQSNRGNLSYMPPVDDEEAFVDFDEYADSMLYVD